MGTDEDNKDKPYDAISELLKRFYKPDKEIDLDEFWGEVSKKVDSLFHKELYSDSLVNEQGVLMSDEERYWLGIEEYAKNEIGSLKHKTITDHLLQCKECRQNYNDLLDKKKPMIDLMNMKLKMNLGVSVLELNR